MIVDYPRSCREHWRSAIAVRWRPNPHGADALEPGALVSRSLRQRDDGKILNVEFGIVVSATGREVAVWWSGTAVNSGSGPL